MKKPVYILLVLVLLVVGCSNQMKVSNLVEHTSSIITKTPTIGVVIYNFSDTFNKSVRKAIAKAGKGKAQFFFMDSENSQKIQDGNVDFLISKKVNVIVLNPVDRTSVGNVIEKAKAANIPVVFFNSEPLASDMDKWDQVYYVGAKPEESGIMQGQIMANYWKTHPEADKNHDGILQYVMLMGDPEHQDALVRTKFAILALTNAGVKSKQLGSDTAMWERGKAIKKMADFIQEYGDHIEAVFANNDEMALGAIDALKAAGYFQHGKYTPVVGVDATSQGLAALKNGTLLGTVLNDANNQGKATFNIAYTVAKKMLPDKTNTGFDIVDGKYVWVPNKRITNVQ